MCKRGAIVAGSAKLEKNFYNKFGKSDYHDDNNDDGGHHRHDAGKTMTGTGIHTICHCVTARMGWACSHWQAFPHSYWVFLLLFLYLLLFLLNETRFNVKARRCAGLH